MKKFFDLIDVKSIVTLTMTFAMVLMLTGIFKPPTEIFGLYATSYGSVITYFFTKKKNGNDESGGV